MTAGQDKGRATLPHPSWTSQGDAPTMRRTLRGSRHGAVNIDVIDRQLIALLQQNGRMSTCEMAQRMDCIGDRAVRYRLERLQREGLIHVSAVLITSRWGLPLMADVLLDVVPWKLVDAIKRLTADDRVCYVAASPDQTQVSFQVNGHDRMELMQIVGDVVAPIEGVTSVRVVPLSRLFKDVTGWVAPLEGAQR
jgi:Lrp/AsnC family transcriptional regulator, leucine-responsive regulatory protein